MKANFISAIIISSLLMIACNNNTSDNETSGAGVNDSTIKNPVTNAMNYQADESQHIPQSDSSNISNADTSSTKEKPEKH